MLSLWLSLAALAGEADDALRDARAAERAGDPGAELSACQEVLALEPAHPTCARRVAWLEARRDPGGGFDGLLALQAVRRGYRGRPPEASTRQVEAIAADLTFAEEIRWEARSWMARELLERRQDPEAALAWTGPMWSEQSESTAPGPRAEVAGALHARALAASGQLDEARAIQAALGRPTGSREGIALEATLARRARGRWLAWGALGAFVLAAAGPALRGWRRSDRPRPQGLAPLALALGGAAALAGGWDRAAGIAVAGLLPPLALVHLLAAGALIGSDGWHRAALRGLAGLASLAAIFLALDRSRALDWIGL